MSQKELNFVYNQKNPSCVFYLNSCILSCSKMLLNPVFLESALLFPIIIF